jgi:dihydromethanopterin reductase (acceptor)
MDKKRIAWAITGAGHTLEECVKVLQGHANIDIFLSRAAEEVLQMYHLNTLLPGLENRMYREAQASSPMVSRFFAGVYRVLVIAPATSNSVAKFVYGISDTLVTNLFAQAGKSQVPILVYPTDQSNEVDSLGPRRESIKVYPRPIDLENTAKLRSFPGVTVVCNREELESNLDVCRNHR